MRIFEQKIFCPISSNDMRAFETRPDLPDSYAIHWYDGSWLEEFPIKPPSGSASSRSASAAA